MTVGESHDKEKKSEHRFTLCIEKLNDKTFKFQMSFDSGEELKEWREAITNVINSTNSQLFETSVTDASMKTNQLVPSFITYIVDLLMPNIEQEGLFRIPGNQNAISDKKAKYNEGENQDLTDCDVHLLGGVLKVYFRELAEPIFPYNVTEKLVEGSKLDDDESVKKNMAAALAMMPRANYVTIGYMMKFLKKVSLKHSTNKMDPTNLAIVFAPSFLRSPPGKDQLSAMSSVSKICEMMITDADTIFADIDDKVVKSPIRPILPDDNSNTKPEFTVSERPFIDQVLNLHHESFDHVYFCRVLRIAPKTKALDEICLCVGHNRIYGFSRGGKLEFESHYLDLVELNSPSPSTLIISYGNNIKPTEVKLRPISYHSADINVILRNIIQRYQFNFSGITKDDWFHIVIQPDYRKEEILGSIDLLDPEEGCGGFVYTYQTVCDYYNIPVVENLIWDLENLFFHNDIKTFIVSECARKDRYPNEDFKALIHSLHHNTWFTSLVADGLKLGNDSIQIIANMFKTNKTIKTLKMANVGATGGAFISLADAFLSNSYLALTHIDFSGNNIDDKSAERLGQAIEGFNALHSFNISNCSVGKKGMLALLLSLQKNTQVYSSLHSLDISGNSLDNPDCSRNIGLVLGKATELRFLNLANTNPIFIHICAAFEKSNVVTLNASDCKIGKQQTDVVEFMKRFPNVEELILTTFPVPVNHLIDILGHLKKIRSIDISDNDLSDEGILSLLEYLQKADNNKSLEELNMNRMFGRRTKDRQQVMNSLVAMLEIRPIKKLRLRGGSKSQLKSDLFTLVIGLLNNKTLRLLDITGNQCGDSLAYAFAKVLQHNDTIDTLYWDDNGTTMSGLKTLKIGLERNKAIKKMPLPLIDMSNILKVETDLTSVVALTSEIQEIVFDNAYRAVESDHETSGEARKVENLSLSTPGNKTTSSKRTSAPKTVSQKASKKMLAKMEKNPKGTITRANVTRASLILSQSLFNDKEDVAE